jgi:hypothetical protein
MSIPRQYPILPVLSSACCIVSLALWDMIFQQLHHCLRYHGGLCAAGSVVNVLAHLIMAGSAWITACC